MVRNAACPMCKSGKEKEVIKGGMEQVVTWDDGYVVQEMTTYEKNDNYSTYYCNNKDCSNYGKEV